MMTEASPTHLAPAHAYRAMDAMACGLLVAVTCGLYAPVLNYDFVDWDDPLYVTANANVQSGLNASSLKYAWTTLDYGNWIPITWMSLELDAELFGTNPRAFHVTSVVWHVLNVCLLYVVLRRATDSPGRSAVVALLFAVHPLHIESVAWIAERKDVLSTFFLLASLLAYEWYARRPSLGRMAAVTILMSLGLMSKSMVVTLPVLLLLADYWPLGRIAWRGRPLFPESRYAPRAPWRLVMEKAPLFLLSLAVGLLTIAAQNSTRAVGGLQMFSLPMRVGNAINGYAWYLGKTFVPTDLCAFYRHPMSELSWSSVAVSACVLIVISFLVWRLRRHAHLPFGWLWFLISLLPVIGLLQVGNQAYADRYSYVPHIGLMTLLVWAFDGWLERLSCGGRVRAGAAGIAVAACMLVSSRQLPTWKNSETLWTQALKVDPDNPAAHYQIGIAYRDSGDVVRAQRHFERVLVKRQNEVRTLLNLGAIHHESGRWQEAAEYYAFALRVDPTNESVRSNLAQLKQSHPEAFAAPQDARHSAEAVTHNERGLAEARAGRGEDALRHFREAVQIDPKFADAHNNAAMMLMELRRPGEARRHFEQAVDAAPDNTDFRFNLAQLLEEMNELKLAREQYEAMLRLKPHDVEAKLYLEQLSKRLRQ